MKTTAIAFAALAVGAQAVHSALPSQAGQRGVAVPLPEPTPLAHSRLSRRRLTSIVGGAAKTPPETYAAYSTLGTKQGTMALQPMVLQSLLAGAFIALGGALAMSVGAMMPGIASSNPGLQKMLLGAFGLPVGLLMVVMTGGQLFTGNTALVSAAVLDGTVTPGQLIRNWIVSFFGNFAGALAVVYMLSWSGLFGMGASVAKVATGKVGLDFGQAFIRGILCNWMVCLALWQANAASDLAGKALGIWLPISAFVAIGFEHSVANMMFIPLGMLCGADISVADFLFKNLLPVTLGNIVAGSVLVGGAYHVLHGKKN